MPMKNDSICWLFHARARVHECTSAEIREPNKLDDPEPHLMLMYKLGKSAKPAIRRSKCRTWYFGLVRTCRRSAVCRGERTMSG